MQLSLKLHIGLNPSVLRGRDGVPGRKNREIVSLGCFAQQGCEAESKMAGEIGIQGPDIEDGPGHRLNRG